MRLRHPSARGRVLGILQGQCSCGGTDVCCPSCADELHRANVRGCQCYLLVYPCAWGRKDNQLPKIRVQNAHKCQCIMYWKWLCRNFIKKFVKENFLDFVKPFFHLPLRIMWLYCLIMTLLLLLLLFYYYYYYITVTFFRCLHVSSLKVKSVDEGWIGECPKGSCYGLL